MLLTIPRKAWPEYWENAVRLYHTPRWWRWLSCALCVGRPWRLRCWLEDHETTAWLRLGLWASGEVPSEQA